MNEQAQQALANLLSIAVDGLNGAVEFSKAQLPEVVEQLLMWHMVESLIWFIGSTILLIVSVGTFVGMYKGRIEESDGLIMLSLCATPVGFLGMAFNLEWLKIMIAPKLYLLEYAAQLVK